MMRLVNGIALMITLSQWQPNDKKHKAMTQQTRMRRLGRQIE